jgi:hypothetical protein
LTLICHHSQVKGVEPLTMMVRGQNTPPDLKALALNALAQVREGVDGRRGREGGSFPSSRGWEERGQTGARMSQWAAQSLQVLYSHPAWVDCNSSSWSTI